MKRNEELGHVLRFALAPLLPEPLTPSDWEFHYKTSGKPAGDSPWATVTLHPASPLGMGDQPRLIAIPGGRRPRAIVPAQLVQSAGRRLLRPKTTMLTTGQRLASLAVQALPGVAARVAGSTLEVRTSEPSRLLRHLRSLEPDLHIAMTLNPLWYERPVLHALTADGDAVAVAKFAMGPEGHKRARREYATLEAVAASQRLGDTVPLPIAVVGGHLGAAVITSPAHGDPPPGRITPPMKLWLEACRGSRTVALRTSALLRELLEAEYLPPWGRELHQTVLERHGSLQVPVTITHGDFVPWNMFVSGDRIAVFDWEEGMTDGVPYWDEVYFRVQVGMIKHQWGAKKIAEAVARAHPAPRPEARIYRAISSLVLVRLAVVKARAGNFEESRTLEAAAAILTKTGWLSS